MRRIWPQARAATACVQLERPLLGREHRLQLGPIEERCDFASCSGRVRHRVGIPRCQGVIGGFQSGYNYQFGQWVSALKPTFKPRVRRAATLQISALPATFLTTDHKLTWFGTSRTRLGVLWSPNVLLYGTAGVAYGQVKETPPSAPGASVTGTFKDTKAGWTAGAGVESDHRRRLDRQARISLHRPRQDRADARHAGLGQVISETRRFTDNIVRVGFNYKWGGGY